MLFTSLFTVYSITNVMLQRNLPNQMINTISADFFNSFAYCIFCFLGTVFCLLIAIFAFLLIRIMILLFFLYLFDVYTYSPIYHTPICSLPVSFESYLYFISLVLYRMSNVISKEHSKIKTPLNWSFEIKNGLLGVKRDRFVSLIGYVHFDENDNKTRNVWKNHFFIFIFFFFLSFFTLCNFLIFVYFLYRWWESVGTYSPG
jgi:hypothetical protein